MNPTMTGKCLCGATGYDFSGETKFAIQCYCRDCQQISGGGHLPQIAIGPETFVSKGKMKVYQTESAAGNVVEVWFCSECGSPMYKTSSKMPDVKFLCAGSLAKDLVNEPFQKVFEECQRIWDR